MDMTKHLKRWLNESTLREEFGGRYQGRISEVIEEPVHNRFSGKKQVEPVLLFSDGWRLLPNLTQRRTLIELLGSETDEWVHCELVVFLMLVEKRDKKTREVVRTSYEKRVCLPAEVAFIREA